MRIAVIGLGLIGGSIALAARERLQAQTLGWDPDPTVLETALERGAIASRVGSLADAVAGADAVFVAAPVGSLPALIGEVLDAAGADCVVSDVGSTKRAIVAAHNDERFVGGHPLAGAETSGIEHARADLFDGATWYLTPTQTTDGMLYERLHRLLSGLGARPAALDAETHDRLLALVSHLPHIFANVLVAMAAAGSPAAADSGPGRSPGGDPGRGRGPGPGPGPGRAGGRLPAVGPSFRDATRVAGANSGIWTDIYISNRDALIPVLDDAIARLGAVRETLAAGDGVSLTDWNEAAGEDHRRLMATQLAGGEWRELRVPVPNRPGVVAQLALELGRLGVNIADLALYPAADMSEGVVALWISGEDDTSRAERLIADLGFPVFRP
jgi:prephenate dehydrogenase